MRDVRDGAFGRAQNMSVKIYKEHGEIKVHQNKGPDKDETVTVLSPALTISNEIATIAEYAQPPLLFVDVYTHATIKPAYRITVPAKKSVTLHRYPTTDDGSQLTRFEKINIFVGCSHNNARLVRTIHDPDLRKLNHRPRRLRIGNNSNYVQLDYE